jgi:hypothetical protein
MPTTIRIAASLTDINSSSEDNVDFVRTTQAGRHERWSIGGGNPATRFYWPLEGESNLFLQIWQPQPALHETTLSISYPNTSNWSGWGILVPAVGRVPFLVSKPPLTDIIELIADQYSVEVDALFF